VGILEGTCAIAGVAHTLGLGTIVSIRTGLVFVEALINSFNRLSWHKAVPAIVLLITLLADALKLLAIIHEWVTVDAHLVRARTTISRLQALVDIAAANGTSKGTSVKLSFRGTVRTKAIPTCHISAVRSSREWFQILAVLWGETVGSEVIVSTLIHLKTSKVTVELVLFDTDQS
jgi:hypothetical protein